MGEGQKQGHPAYLWWNGERVRWEDATVHVTDLGWSTVGGVFEGIRAYWDDRAGELSVFRLQEHLDRLVRSMKLVRLPLDYSVAALTDAIVDLLRVNDVREDTYIRPMGYAGNTTGKRFAQVGGESHVLINTHPMASHLLTGLQYKAKISSWHRIGEDTMPPRVKNFSNYRNGQLASQEARLDGYDTAFLLDRDGKVTEAPGACVALIRGNQLITPDLTSGILESITRDALLVLAREVLGLDVVERRVDRTELYVADEVFTCGTAAEITPVVEIDHYPVGDGAIGPKTRELERVFHDVLRGREDRYAGWRTPVGVAVPA
ncbi:MAG: Branched-chain amino acid aminotransferase [uncultured Thermomicrobiales bacterium]|uniref:Branched-chain-amino-acid aminotransferase n=1 Tax=uncultured Thermomicrobiales bacterium TaxID=1645740 RepID=A0A6J4V0S9_9BACT|nr:MAG: Branched-chain amino acid aminotransferase [uncultured Thermomicrobiales bacterium]